MVKRSVMIWTVSAIACAPFLVILARIWWGLLISGLTLPASYFQGAGMQ